MAMAERKTDDLLRDIKRYIANPPKTSVVLEISPELAGAILEEYNTENRSLKPRKIKSIVSALRNNEWIVTGETIKFSPRRLIDGQNRLTACMESERPITSHVVFGIPDEAFAIIDTGASRTPGDILGIAGIHDPNSISHIVTWIHTLENARGSRSRLQLSPNEILHLYRTRYSDAGEHIGWGRQLQKATGAPITRGALLHYAYTRSANAAMADRFMSTWISPWAENDGPPQARLLRRRLDQIKSVMAGQVTVTNAYAMGIKAWNAFIENRAIDAAGVKWGEDEPFPQIVRKGGRASE